ncbi:MAG: type II secretion system protein [Candidatus Paceibacterota bacterium]
MINNNQKTKGFTLVETLVALLIFGFVSVILVNIFVSVLNSQKRILQNQELMNQSSYALEYMTKAIRMTEKDMTGACSGAAGENFRVGTSPVSIAFLAYDLKDSTYKCVQFLIEDNAIKERRSTDGNLPSGTALPITSSAVSVERLEFYVTGDILGDNIQPKITIMIKMKSLSSSTNAPVIIVQTTVSQRKLDI